MVSFSRYFTVCITYQLPLVLGVTTFHFQYFLITGISFGTEVYIAVRHNYPLQNTVFCPKCGYIKCILKINKLLLYCKASQVIVTT
jgi:hypothetical protein